MRKLLLSLALLMAGAMAVWAQDLVLTYENITAPQELSADDAATIRAMKGMTIVADVEITNSNNWSLLFSAVADYTSNNTANNSIWGLGTGGNSLRYYVGPRDGGWYSSTNGTLTTAVKKIICTYNGSAIRFYADGTFVKEQTSTQALSSYNGANAKFYLGGVVYNNNTEWGTFNGTISKVEIYNGAFTDDQVAALCYPENAVTDYTKFVSGNVYTFKSNRGWLMASEGTNFVYSSGKLNNVTPAEDNAYCQWVYYATEKGKYLYNVGVNKFVTFNSANLNSIPLSDTPNTSAIEVKNSTLAGYPILLGLESKAINQNVTDQAYTYGVCLWGDGWTGTSYHNDPGSACLVLSQGEADEATLEAIQTKVDAFEADNTLAVADLDAAIAKAEDMAQYIGTGVGKYTTDADYATKFAAIVAFREAIVATNTPTPAEVEAKTAEVEALIASLKLNMPEEGKFYTFKNDSYYITCNTIETGNKNIALSEEKGGEVIYYFDGTHLLAYKTGLYIGLNSTDWGFEAVGSDDISTIEFVAAANGVVAKYNIKSGGRWLHRTDAFVNRCSSNTCGNAHNWTIEEVETLPVTIGSTGYATFNAPVALTIPANVEAYTGSLNGNWLTLNKVEKTILPANTPVILTGAANTYDFVVTEGGEAIPGNALSGTIAKVAATTATNPYTLQSHDGGVAFKKFKSADPSANLTLTGFKAYLDLTDNTGAGAIGIRFEDGTTGIDNSELTIQNSELIFDLMGRRVETMTEGNIYIVNGKKVIR